MGKGLALGVREGTKGIGVGKGLALAVRGDSGERGLRGEGWGRG